jgi:serine/threonine protein kinase
VTCTGRIVRTGESSSSRQDRRARDRELAETTRAGAGTAAAIPAAVSRPQSVTIPLRPIARCADAPGARVGPYHLIGQLARGGTASVYLGQHAGTAERVALKILAPAFRHDDEMIGRLLRERDVAHRARHPGLLAIHGADYVHDTPYLIMELLDGESLQALVERDELSCAAAVAIGLQIATAVAALHGAGVIHCDLKPGNIYVLYEPGFAGWPLIKVIDYGVARFEGDPFDAEAIAGTPAFMAPEQWMGRPCFASDVYALGCMLYELVTHRPLFSGTLPELMRKHCEQLPARPTAIDSDLEHLIVRTLAMDPSLRPTMTDLQHELLAISYRQQPAVALHAAG